MEQQDFFITTMGAPLDTSDLIVTEDTLNNNIRLSDFGKGVQKLFFEVAFFKRPETFFPNPSRFDENKRGLYISIISGMDINQFSSKLDKTIEKLRPRVQDFDFDLFKSDILHFTESLKEAA
jgi:hypothetical protein